MSGDIREFVGKAITIRYDLKRCVHAAECIQGAPEVFDPRRAPWIDPDAAPPDAIADVIGRCPSGALQFHRCDGAPVAVQVGHNTIEISRDGPLLVSGDVLLYAADGDLISSEHRVSLCRCGASRHKPFCDGSHAREGFQDPGSVRETRTQSLVDAATRLEVRSRQNGPYIVKGSLTLVSADGEHRVQRAKAALCRCGASANKPFCDGSHSGVAFLAD